MGLDIGLDAINDLAADPNPPLVRSRESIRGPDGTLITSPSLVALQAALDDAGIPGYDLPNAANTRAELNRLRTYLWERGTIPSAAALAARTPLLWLNGCGEKTVGISDPGYSGDRFGAHCNGAEFVYPEGRYTRVDYVIQLTAADFNCTVGPLLPDNSRWLTTVPAIIRFSVGPVPPGVGLTMQAEAASSFRLTDGREFGGFFTDWTPKSFWTTAASPAYSVFGTPTTVSGGEVQIPSVAFRCPISASVTIAAAWCLYRLRIAFTILPTTSNAGGNYSRVLHQSKSDWRRMASIPAGVPVQTNLYRHRHQRIIAAEAFALTDADKRTGFWRLNPAPSAYRAFECYAGGVERWKKYRQDFFPATAENANIVPSALSGGYSAPQVYARLPSAALVADIFPDVPPSSTATDTRSRSDTNAFEFDTFTFTLGLPSGPQSFTLPKVRNGLTGGFAVAGIDAPQFWKFPIPGMTREKYLDFTYNNNVSEVKAARSEVQGDIPADKYYGGGLHTPTPGEMMVPGAIGTQTAEYFFNQALTSADDSTFWYRDVFAVHPDSIVVNTVNRWSRWCILPDGPGYALYLFNPTQQVPVGVVPPGTLVYETRSFYPAGTVTAEEYRRAYKLGYQGFFVGNMPDFQAPYRYFGTKNTNPLVSFDDSAQQAPIAAWTVGKQIGGAFTSGMTVKLRVQRRVSRSDSQSFGLRVQYGWEDNQTLNVGAITRPFVSALSEVYDLQTSRVNRKFGTVVFRNKVARVNLYPDFYQRGRIRDLRLYSLAWTQSGGDGLTNGGATPYAPENLPGFIVLNPYRVNELNPGDYTAVHDPATGTTTITLLRTDGLNANNIYGGGWFDEEFITAGISYDHFSGSLPQIEVTYGNRTRTGILPGENTFTPYRRAVVAAGYKEAPPFYENDDGSLSQRWARLDAWVPVYRRTLNPISVPYISEDYTYHPDYPPTMPGVDIPGIIVTANFPEDGTVRFYGGWKSRRLFTYGEIKTHTSILGATISPDNFTMRKGLELQTDRFQWQWTFERASNGKPCLISFAAGQIHLTDHLGNPLADTEQLIESQTRHLLTQMNFLEGSQIIAPQVGAEIDLSISRLCYFAPVFFRQNFEVRSTWKEISGATVGPDIRGPAMSFHANETAALLAAWVEAGKPGP